VVNAYLLWSPGGAGLCLLARLNDRSSVILKSCGFRAIKIYINFSPVFITLSIHIYIYIHECVCIVISVRFYYIQYVLSTWKKITVDTQSPFGRAITTGVMRHLHFLIVSLVAAARRIRYQCVTINNRQGYSQPSCE